MEFVSRFSASTCGTNSQIVAARNVVTGAKPIMMLALAASVLLRAGVPNTATAAQHEENTTGRIVYYDMTALNQLDLSDPVQLRRYWDETHLVVSLQGLVNRDAARLYLRYVQTPDDFWWQRMTEPGGWLEGRQVDRVDNLADLLHRFRDDYRGAVVWDERVSATSNLASTIAGCDNLLCLRYDPSQGSLYHELTHADPALEVKTRLLRDDGRPLFTGRGTIPNTNLDSTGSAKCDAYRWLIERYVKTGKTNPTRMGYYLDGFWLRNPSAVSRQHHTLTNHDFVIARRGLLFDLNVWDDEACVDDPNQKQGTDADTLRALLRAAYDRCGSEPIIHVAGFVPWAFKYTSHAGAGGSHEPVPTEWKYAEILSCFNAYMDADAIGLAPMANASFYQHYPLRDRYPQNSKPTRESLTRRGILDQHGHIAPHRYVAHYVGDYDAAAWLYHMLPKMWTDPARGTTPLSWAFNPNLCERFPLGMAWSREHRTPNDFFVAGDSGAGYLNPGLLSAPRPHSSLPSGVATWEHHNQRLFAQWDITLTGFVIDGYARGLTAEGLDSYARFSPDGIVAQKIPRQGVHKGMPYLRMRADLPADPKAAARIMYAAGGTLPQFGVCRSILRTPSWYARVEQELKQVGNHDAMVVDLYTLMWLVREYETHKADYVDNHFGRATEVSAQPGTCMGIVPVFVTDGPFDIQRQGDQSFWFMPSDKVARYLYFDVDDAFARDTSGDLEIKIEYRDDPNVRFGLDYDSSDKSAAHHGAYKAHPRIIKGQGSRKWRTAVFAVADARFAGSQNGSADFRLYFSDGPLRVRAVSVRRVDSRKSAIDWIRLRGGEIEADDGKLVRVKIDLGASPRSLNLAPLADLADLEELELAGKGTYDLSPLVNLPRLERLELCSKRPLPPFWQTGQDVSRWRDLHAGLRLR